MMGTPIKARIEHVAFSSVGGRGRAITLRFEGYSQLRPRDKGRLLWLWDEEPPKPPRPKPVAQMNEGELRAEVGTMTDGEYRDFLEANWLPVFRSDTIADLRKVTLELRKIRGK